MKLGIWWICWQSHIRPFCLWDELWNTSIIRPANRKEPSHLSRLTVVCDEACYTEIKQRQTENAICCVGFDTDSAPLKDSNCNQFHRCLRISCNITFQILGSQFSYYKSKSLMTNTCARMKFRVWSALPIRPINRNISDHFLVQIIHIDGVKIVAGRLLCRITSSASHFRQPFHDVNPPSICEVVGSRLHLNCNSITTV